MRTRTITERLVEARGERYHSMVEGAVWLGIVECLLACLYFGAIR